MPRRYLPFPETATEGEIRGPPCHRRSMNTETYDVAIIGGGAAGLSAALVLGRARRRVVVIDAGTPRNAPASHMHGFLSRDGTAPTELLRVARDEVRHYGVELVDDRVVEATAGFTLALAGGATVRARHVLIATGATDELPDLPNARERWGRDLLHCPYCHGWEVRDQPIGVLATGPGSVEHAHLLRQWSDDVIFFTHTCTITDRERGALDARGIEIVDGAVERLVVDDRARAVRVGVDGEVEPLVAAENRLRAIQLTDGRTVERAALFVRPALSARADGLAVALGCETLAGGLLRTHADGRTTVPGIWAAGNATNPRAQVITAAGEGSAVAIAINTELVQHDIAGAVQDVAAMA
jgi:thioredoxin reductase